MTRAYIDNIASLMVAAGRRTVPVPIAEWREYMATKIKATVKDGKVKPVDKTPAPLVKGKHAKAARIEKGLKANRERAKAKKG